MGLPCRLTPRHEVPKRRQGRCPCGGLAKAFEKAAKDEVARYSLLDAVSQL
jgi:hypothetical protein